MRKKLTDIYDLARGKIRRYYYHKFRRDYIKKMHAKRHGECARCGTCCKLLFKCPFLDESTHPALCRVHNSRPTNCRIFPVDKADLRDRDIVDTGHKCGYYFETEL